MAKINLGWREYKTEFQGSEVSMELRPLKTASLLEITDLFEGYGGNKTAIVGQLKMQDVFRHLHADHVRNLTGIEMEGDDKFGPDVVAGEALFLGLAVEIISELMSISHLLRGDSKNSSAPAGPTGGTEGAAASE